MMIKINVFNWMMVLLLFACSSSSSFEKIPDAEVNSENVAIAKELASKILSAQKAGKHYPLTTQEATSTMVQSLNESVQKNAYKEVKGIFGDYKGLAFDHVLKPKDGTLYKIYRFKGDFDSNAKVEVRTVLDGEGKLAGFFIKKWKDNI